jgi:hypothetical protein
MNTTATSNNANPINDLIAKVMDKFDTNKDKQLSSTEFGSFLNGLLQGTATAADVTEAAGDSTGTDPVSLPEGAFDPTPCNTGLMHGFAMDNYYASECKTMKYTFARIAADYDPRQPGALDRLVEDPRFKAAFPNAKKADFDKIDFGGQLSEGDGTGVPVGIVDVGESFLKTACGPAWQWFDLANDI